MIGILLHQFGIAIEGCPIRIDLGLLRRSLFLGSHVVGLQRPELQLGLPKIRLRLIDGELELGRIEAEQHLALLHRLTLPHHDLIDQAGDVRGDVQDVALDIGVLGSDVASAGQPIDQAADDQQDGAEADKPIAKRQAPSLAPNEATAGNVALP